MANGNRCQSCGGKLFGFHACQACDLVKVIAWQDERIAQLEAKLKQRKRKHG